MAVVARGWSKTASTAVKLATAERIIGYQFNDVDRLYEALDQRKQPNTFPSGKQPKERPRNSRLATVGDAHAKLRMAQQYYDNRDLVGVHWGLISATALSNNQMSEFGFRLGLDECGIPHMIDKEYDMATTVEAVFAAVEMDGAGRQQFHKVMARFGIQHRLVEPLQRRWIYKMVKSRLGLPDRFFIGHHFRLQEGIFETKLKRSTAQEKNIGPRRWLWESVKRMWQGPPGKPPKAKKIRPSLWGPQRPGLRSATRSSEIVEPTAKGTRPTAMETTITSPEDVATSETKILDDESLGRLEDDPVEKQKTAEAAESLSSEIFAPSQPPESQPQSVLAKEGTPEYDVATAENGSQDSNKASIDGPSPEISSKHGAASDAGPEVGHQPHEDFGLESVEATEAGDTPEKFQKILDTLNEKGKELMLGQLEMEATFRQLRLAGQKKTSEQLQDFVKLKSRRKRIKRLQLLWRNKLEKLKQLDKRS